jgi:undecaprenyl-diphosphatase
MPLYQVIILAVVQALTEFLPVSSTAHLFLFPWLLGWPDPGLTFTIAVHAGTLVAVLLYFFRTWLEFTLAGFGLAFPRTATPEQVRTSRRLFWFLVAGTIPAALAGYFLEHHIETTFRSPYLMGTMLIAVGVLMWVVESRSQLSRTMESLTLGDALLIGTAQAIALVPGVSRSGITVIAGIFRGMTREAAARFTFLLSTPIIAGAAAKKLLDLRAAPPAEGMLMALGVGAAVSAVAGYLVIAFFIRYLQTRTLKIFIVYRILFGIVILLLAFLQGGPAR